MPRRNSDAMARTSSNAAAADATGASTSGAAAAAAAAASASVATAGGEPRRRLAVPEPSGVSMSKQIHHSPSEVTLNKNVNWLSNPGFWVWYLGLIAVGWLVLAGLLDDAGLAWTYTHLIHGIITYYLFHWTKGTPFVEDDHGKYQLLTFWEQVDGGTYATANRKLLTIVPVVLFVLATHGTDFRKQPLGLNLAVVLVLLIAKLPALHKVRIFGINKY